MKIGSSFKLDLCSEALAFWITDWQEEVQDAPKTVTPTAIGAAHSAKNLFNFIPHLLLSF